MISRRARLALHAGFAVVGTLCVAHASQGQPSRSPALPSVATIVQRNIDARGGLERIRAIRTLILRSNGARFMARARPNYIVVGDPTTNREYAEGSDGAPWEYYRDAGLVMRVTGAPEAAIRHTAVFDDPLVSSLEPGMMLRLRGLTTIGDRPAFWIRATYPDSFQLDVFVDTSSSLLIANRKIAPIHAFGASIATESRFSDFKRINGVLFPMRVNEFEVATGKPIVDGGGTWDSVEVNTPLPPEYFAPPSESTTPLARMMNAVFRARSHPAEALRWYNDFRRTPETSGIDTREAMEIVGYQALKSGAARTAMVLLEANITEHGDAPSSWFGLGRAYRTVGREREAMVAFRHALRIDPGYQRARDAVNAGRRK